MKKNKKQEKGGKAKKVLLHVLVEEAHDDNLVGDDSRGESILKLR